MVEGELATEDQFEAIWSLVVEGGNAGEERGSRGLVLFIVRITVCGVWCVSVCACACVCVCVCKHTIVPTIPGLSHFTLLFMFTRAYKNERLE